MKSPYYNDNHLVWPSYDLHRWRISACLNQRVECSAQLCPLCSTVVRSAAPPVCLCCRAATNGFITAKNTQAGMCLKVLDRVFTLPKSGAAAVKGRQALLFSNTREYCLIRVSRGNRPSPPLCITSELWTADVISLAFAFSVGYLLKNSNFFRPTSVHIAAWKQRWCSAGLWSSAVWCQNLAEDSSPPYKKRSTLNM